MNEETKKSLQSYLETMVTVRYGGFGGTPKREKPEGMEYYCVEDLLLKEGTFASPEELTLSRRNMYRSTLNLFILRRNNVFETLRC